MSIATGITGDEKVNCYDAFNIGVKAMKKINGQNFKDLKLTKKDKVVSLLTVNNKIKVYDEVIPIDELLLFQRICVLKKSEEELQTYLNFELAPYPVTLFDQGLMRKTTKSSFYDLFTQLNISVNDNNIFSYAIDGGMLLHRCKWQLDEKFETICNHYIRYLKNNYGNNVFVVFDGYRNINCTKSAERYRRSLKNASTHLIFDENMHLKIRQEKFLANSNN